MGCKDIKWIWNSQKELKDAKWSRFFEFKLLTRQKSSSHTVREGAFTVRIFATV